MSIAHERVTQKHPTSAVSAPGVQLWATATTYLPEYRGIVVETDVVEAGDVELAHEDRPYDFFLDVETINDIHADYPGVFQDREFGEGAFGEGPFGGIETDWAIVEGPPGWKLEGL